MPASSLVSPLLAALSGVLEGAQEARERLRQREFEEQDRRRRDQLHNLQMAQLLAALSEDPAFQVGLPGAGSGGLLDAAGQAIGDAMSPGTAAATEAGLRAGLREGVRRIPPGAQPAHGVLDLAEIAIGDRRIPVRFDPAGRRRQKETQEEKARRRNRQAFETLRGLAPNLYKAFVEDFDYVQELEEFYGDLRRGRLEETRFRRGQAAAERDEQRKRRRQQAETRAVNMLRSGAAANQVHQAIETDPQLRGVLTFDDVKKLENDVRSTEAGQTMSPDIEERRRGLEKKLGTPTKPVHQVVLHELARGKTKEQIVEGIRASGRARGVSEAAIEEQVKEAARYMVRLN